MALSSPLFILTAILLTAEWALPESEARRLSQAVHRDSAEFSTHMARVIGFRCSEPQPRAVLSSDVITEGISPEEHIMPPMTVLHRCDGGTGCCDQTEGMSCSPAEDGVATVSLVFRVQAHFQRKARFVWATATNHTACECRNQNSVK
ncbi:uncharacterized protein LOC124164158 [Ischnura elegans]|uniref:uncharacterized protein LOC124164158 n=1 Tax=Ischnura elegans TaxID=197161 RepID=UPI001ED86D91|nr:uncharacterized protein LOC124164158 [Ischnura elegans]